MIERAFVHVAGPAGAGKTTLVEAMLRGIDRWWLAARCVRNDSLRRSRETSAKSHPELRRYRAAGASGAALFEFPGRLVGAPIGSLARRHKSILEQGRADLLEAITRMRNAPPPKASEHWAVADGFEGIGRAQLVVVNVRDESERGRAAELVVALGRLRTESALFDDILGTRGTKIPITAVIADLTDAKDAGLNKALARVGRGMRRK